MGPSSRTKLIIVLSAAFLLLLVVGAIAYELISGPGHKTRQVKVDPAAVAAAGPGQAPAIPAKPESEWLPKFTSVYALADGQSLKRVPKPFIPERMEYYRARAGAPQVQAIPQGPDFYLLDYNGKDFSDVTAWFGQPDVEGMITSVLRIDNTLLTGPPEVLHKQLGGDIVVKKPATLDEKRAGLVDMLAKDLKKNFTLEQKDLDREVIVLSGKFAYTGPTTVTASAATQPAARNRPSGAGRIIVYRGRPRGNGWSTRGSALFVRYMQNVCQTPIVVDGVIGGENQFWEMDQSGYLGWVRGRGPDPSQVDELLANVAAQSQLRFRREHRMLKTWVLSEGSAPWGVAAWPTTVP
jgi:hypothetical protein